MSKTLCRRFIQALDRVWEFSPPLERYLRSRHSLSVYLSTCVLTRVASASQDGVRMIEESLKDVDREWCIKARDAARLRAGDLVQVEYEVCKIMSVRAVRYLRVLRAKGRTIVLRRTDTVRLICPA